VVDLSGIVTAAAGPCLPRIRIDGILFHTVGPRLWNQASQSPFAVLDMLRRFEELVTPITGAMDSENRACQWQNNSCESPTVGLAR